MEARRWGAGANPDETGTGATASDGDETVCVCVCVTGCESKRCGCVKDGVPCTSRCTCNNCKNCEDLDNEDVGGQVENEGDASEADKDTWDDAFYQ